MSNLDEADYLLHSGRSGENNAYKNRRSSAISMLSIAKSLEFLVTRMTAKITITDTIVEEGHYNIPTHPEGDRLYTHDPAVKVMPCPAYPDYGGCYHPGGFRHDGDHMSKTVAEQYKIDKPE